MWRFSIATKKQIAGFPTTVKPYQIKTSKIAPKANSSGDVGRFSIFKSKFANRAAGKEVMQMPRMPKYLKREWAFFLGDCGRKKYNPLPSDKLLKGAQLICNEPFLRIFTRLNIQNTDFVFIRHCNNSFFDNKNTAVSGDTAGVTNIKCPAPYALDGGVCLVSANRAGGRSRERICCPAV